MKTNKRILSLPALVLALAPALGIGTLAYAATGNFTMTYLPGTSDTVTNMPANDDGVSGQAYTVSSTTPQREGYEFLGWELDYEIELPIHYSVKYILRDENQHFVKELGSKDSIETYKDIPVTEKPENFEADGYACDNPDEVITKTVYDGEVIKFYYHEAPIHYSIVYYYDADTSIEGDEVEIYRKDNIEAMNGAVVQAKTPQTYSDGDNNYSLIRPKNPVAKVYDGYVFNIYYTLSNAY